MWHSTVLAEAVKIAGALGPSLQVRLDVHVAAVDVRVLQTAHVCALQTMSTRCNVLYCQQRGNLMDE